MATRSRVCSLSAIALALCACRGGGTSSQTTSGRGDDGGGAQSATEWKLDAVKDPYVLWLAGRGARPDWPPDPIPGLLRAAGAPDGATVEPPVPNLMWDETGLSVTWDASVALPGRSCPEIEAAVDAYLEKTDLGPPPAGARSDIRLFYSAAHGVERVISHSCSDAQLPMTGCPGGDCSQPTSLSIEYAVGMRGPELTSLDSALAAFPTVSNALHSSLLPPFLVEIVESAKLHSIYCERWTGTTCEWDLRFEVVPPGDAKAWILEAIETGKRYGFACDQTWRDPEKDDIPSTQTCSGKNLWFHVRQGRVRIRLSSIIGAETQGTPVQCSADYFAEKGSKPPPEPDPGVQEIMDVPVRRTAVAHMDRVLACYVDHQKQAGRTVVTKDWRRLGDYLERSAYDEETRQEVTVGVQHRPYAQPTANGFFMRVKRQVRDDLAIEMYLRQEDFEKSFGGGYIELKGMHGVPLVRVTLPWPKASAPAESEQAFTDAALAAVGEALARELRGIGRRQECKVLPNMGQECNWVETTPAEQAEMRKRMEADRDKLVARIRADRAEIYGLVANLYPWSRADCAPLIAP